MDDRDIVTLFRDRSENAIPRALEKYRRYCFSIASRILGDDGEAEETVSDALVKAWDTIPPADPQSLKTYLGMLTRQLAVNRFEKERAAKRGKGAAEAFDELSDVLSDRESGEMTDPIALRDALGRFLSELPAKTRGIFLRRYWYAVPTKEIAKEYSMKESAVSMLLSRTREKLRAFLTEEGFDP